MGLKNIVIGWSKHLGLMPVTAAEKKLSIDRLLVCSECEEAKESSALEFINNSTERILTIYCKECKCPCHQKSLISNEECPLGKWADIK